MRYKHDVSREWLEARKDYLTATDIVAMWPTTATGRPAKQNWATVLADKEANVEHYQLTTFGQQARGHALEPYALIDTGFYHWDDTIIVHDDGVISFSPDGMNYELSTEAQEVIVIPSNSLEPDSHLVEIKAFDTYKHMDTAFKLNRGSNLDVVKQISVALMCDNVTQASIILFAPQMKEENLRRFMFTYDKEDPVIKNNIEIIEKIKEDYLKAEEQKIWHDVVSLNSVPSSLKEEDVIKDLTQYDQLNV